MGSRLMHQLREDILQGRLSPGEKINLYRLRGVLQVSLSPLREALARLIAEGLVVFEDNRGYRVAPVSLANLVEITALRAEMETLALRRAVATGGLVWEKAVTHALERLDRTGRKPSISETMEAWELAHSELHQTLIAGCNMPLLSRFCAVLHNLNDRYRRIFLRDHLGDRNVKDEHREIARAAIGRDADEATDMLRQHIQRTGGNLRKALANQLATQGD